MGAGAIGPGSLLLAVDDGGEAYDDCPLPKLTVGRVYECLEVETGNPAWTYGCNQCGSLVGIHLVESGRAEQWAYCVCSFVPAGRRGDFSEALRSVPVSDLVEA